MVVAAETRENDSGGFDLIGVRSAQYVDEIPTVVRFSIAALLDPLPHEADSPMQFSIRAGVPGKRRDQVNLDQLPAMGITQWIEGRRPLFVHDIELEVRSARAMEFDLIYNGTVIGTAEFEIIER